jgi:uncharacterized protein (TIGR02246 family)
MDIDGFMENYKRAWETSDENLLASLFTPDGTYRNTPFAVQQGHEAIKQYWQRTKLQTDIKLTYEVLQRHASGGIAHWHTTYQVTSEDMFKMWAASTGTNMLARKAGDSCRAGAGRICSSACADLSIVVPPRQVLPGSRLDEPTTPTMSSQSLLPASNRAQQPAKAALILPEVAGVVLGATGSRLGHR